jgi:hypothetical protein
MPPRWVTLSIVVAWLGMTAWLFYREVWPQLAPGEPPPFAVDKSDETRLTMRASAAGPRTTWKVYRNDARTYFLDTWIQYNEPDDSFLLRAEFRIVAEEAQRGGIGGLLPQFADIKMDSWYQITREGDLRDIGLDTRYKVTQQGDSELVHVHLDGQPEAHRFAPRARVTLPNLDAQLKEGRPEQVLEPVSVSRHGTVLNPLHPVRRLPGLSPGQSWQVPVLDPFAFVEVIAALTEGESKRRLARAVLGSAQGVQVLRAEVQPDAVALNWLQRDWPCLQIRYGGNQATMELTTWVRAEDGAVLQQEVLLWGDRWLLVRANDT